MLLLFFFSQIVYKTNEIKTIKPSQGPGGIDQWSVVCVICLGLGVRESSIPHSMAVTFRKDCIGLVKVVMLWYRFCRATWTHLLPRCATSVLRLLHARSAWCRTARTSEQSACVLNYTAARGEVLLNVMFLFYNFSYSQTNCNILLSIPLKLLCHSFLLYHT